MVEQVSNVVLTVVGTLVGGGLVSVASAAAGLVVGLLVAYLTRNR